MRRLIGLLVLLLPCAVLADPPKARTIKVGETLIVKVNTQGDKVTNIKYEDALVKVGEVQRVPGRFIYDVPITGVAKGDTTVWIEATGYYTVDIQVVDDTGGGTTTEPAVEKIPTIPFKRYPADQVPEIPAAKPPPPPVPPPGSVPAPPSLPKKVSYQASKPVAKNVRTPDPFVRRPQLVYQAAPAKIRIEQPSRVYVTGQDTNVQLVEKPKQSNFDNSPKWQEEPIPTYAQGTVRSGGTMRVAASG